MPVQIDFEPEQSEVIDFEPDLPDGGLSPETVARLNQESRLAAGGRQMAAGDANMLSAIATYLLAPKPAPSEQELREANLAKRAGVERIPLGTRILSGLDTGIRQGMATPGRLVHGAADLALGAVGAGNSKLARWNADMLKQYAEYEQQMQAKDVQTFGPNDIANQLASGTGRAVTELPLYIAPGMGAVDEAAAVTRAAAAGGLVGGGTQYAQDRGEGRDRADAATYAAASGLITALTTRAFGATGAEAVFRQEGIQGVKNRLLAVLKDAGMEGAEEASDQLQQDILERYSRNPDKPIDATIKEVLMAGAIGGLVGGGVEAGKLSAETAGEAVDNFQENRDFNRASTAAAQEQARLNSLPIAFEPDVEGPAQTGFAGVETAMNQALAKQPIAFEPESSEAQPREQTEVQNSRPAETVAPTTPPDASAQVRRELASLPGAEQDLTDAQAVNQPQQAVTKTVTAPEDVPATKADLKALADFIEKGGPNPFAGKVEPKPAPSETLPGSVGSRSSTVALPDNEARTATAAQRTAPANTQPAVAPKTSAALRSAEFHAKSSERTAKSLREQVARDRQNLVNHRAVLSAAEIASETTRIDGFERDAARLEKQAEKHKADAAKERARLEAEPDQFVLPESPQGATTEVAAPATSTVRSAESNPSNERQRGRVPGNPGMTAEAGSNPALGAAAISPTTPTAQAGTSAPKKSKFRFTDRPYDIIDAAEEHIGGKISWKLIKEANPDWKPTGAARKIFAAKGEPADTAAQALADAGIYKGDPGKVDQFGDAMNAAGKARIGARKQAKSEKAVIAEEIAQNTTFHKDIKQANKRTEPIVANDLNEGDEFTLKGAKLRVTALGFDGDGNVTSVTLDDGKQYGTQTVDGETTLRMDKGSLARAESDNVPFAGGEPPRANDFRFDAAESVEEQKARLKRESAAETAKNQRETMEERAGSRLVATEDTRTQDMFSGAEHRTTRQDKTGQGSLFSQGNPPARGLPREQVQRIASVLGKEMPKALPVTVVNTPAELPSTVRSSAQRQGVRLAGVKGTMVNGRVYLVASNLASPVEARSIWLHEQVGHFATDAQLGRELRSFMEKVATSFADSPVMAEVRRRYPKADNFTLGREVVARIAENPEAEPNLWRRVVAMVRAWLRKSGWVREVTDNDVRAILSRAAASLQSEADGSSVEDGNPAVEFAAGRKDTGTGDLFSYQPKLETAPSAERANTKPEPSSEQPRPRELTDFGQKLGGARKDLAASIKRDISDDDLAGMSLSEIWPKSEIDEIQDIREAALASAVRSIIPAKPRQSWKLKRWVETVKMVKELMRFAHEHGVDDVMARMREDKFQLAKFADKVDVLSVVDRSQWERIGDVANHPGAYRYGENGEQIKSPFASTTVDGRHISATNLPELTEKVKAALGTSAPDAKMAFEVRGSESRGFAINKKGDPLYRKLKSFPTAKEALDYARNNNADLAAAWEAVKESDNVKETDVRAAENRARVGGDHRAGRDATPDMFLDTFGFRGVEFGNWVAQGQNNKERQGMLNASYDALMDLASVVGVPPKALALNGTLGLGLGSRGHGWASAHFEPDTLVINLTKTRGAGTLAHEWFHALDNYFQRYRNEKGIKGNHGDYITQQPESYYENAQGHRLSVSRFNEIQKYGRINKAEWSLVEGVRPEVSQAFTDLVAALDASPMNKRASLIDKGKSGGYWSRVIERAARSFENYVIGKMQLGGYHNDYLANVTSVEDFARDKGRYPYLLPEELKPVADAFDGLFSTIKTKETDAGVALFAAGESNSEMERLQGEIATAEQELKDAIRTHMLPADQRSISKAQALEAKNEAASKLQRLLAEQLKLMTSANVDAARSPEQTADLISQTVDLLNSIQDEISARTAKSQEIPADLTKLRQDLQTRLNLLKGWTDNQTDLEARGQRPEASPETVRDARMVEFESATNPQGNTLGEWWQKMQNGLRYLTSPIPELPLRGEQARKSALFRRGYRLFAVENDRVQKEAAEKVRQVVEPLTKLGRNPQDNAALKQYFRLGEALQRAKMDEGKQKAIRAKMAEVEERLNRDPFNLFRRLVLYRDLWWRRTYLKNEDGKPITLPMGFTVDDVRGELRRLTAAISQHKDGLAITEALRRHYALTDELQKSILEHGEIIPESLRNPLYFPHHIIDSWRDSVARVKPTTEEDFRKYLITPTGSDKLIQSDYLKAMYLHTADVLAHNARVDLVEKYWKPYDISEQLKAQHGDNWKRAYNIPPGYKLFTPYKKLPLRMDYILSREVLADKLGVLFNDGDLRERMGEAGKVLKVKPEDLHAALVAGEKIQWALPAEIADALNGIAKREGAAANPGLGHAIGLPFRKLNSFWKGTKLFAPWNWIRYEYGNLSTDAIDKVLAADPGAAKYLSRAASEVWKSGDKDFKASPEFAAAQREGVFDTVTAGEAGKLLELPAFKEFLTPGEKNLATVKNILGGPARGSKFREATFRYANFLANVERLRAGKEPVYAGAFHGDIEALGEDVDGQRRMLEGDELTYAKAAEISLKTFGDYNSLSQASQWLRKYAVPFWSWQDVNFRYHANQLRNLADGMMGKAGDVGTARKAALRYAAIRTVSTLVAVGIAKELWNQFGGPLLGLWRDDDDLESKLSAQDRRRGHILLGKDSKGQAMVVYTPSAWSDVAEWIGGQNMKRLMLEWARGQITLDQVVKDYAKQLPADTINKLFGSLGPLVKAPYEASSGMSTFPDITDQRRIPPSEKWWRFVSTMTDDRIVNSLRAAFDKDYYSQPALEQLQQIILQVRRRDPQQWAYYEAREDASDWKESKTGKRIEGGAYDAPEAMALRNFRKAIYRGDVANAERFYNRLLEFGYTAPRLEASIRAQHPLADLNKDERAEYLKTLTPKQKQELELATQYYNRFAALDGREKWLFPKKAGWPAQPDPALLRSIIEDQRPKSP